MTTTTTTTTAMRDRMVATVTELLGRDERLALVLADITRAQFEPAFARYPARTVNVGIMEQTMIGVAAGLAMEGFIPVVHSIAPFLVERPFEQLKDDFCFQRLGGNFISIGASYDYSTEGMTHHGSGDVPILRTLPGMRIVVPGTAAEFDRIFRRAYADGAPTYYRLGLAANPEDHAVEFGRLAVLRRGRRATVLAVGPALAATAAAVADLDVTLLYATTVAPFDGETLRACTAEAPNLDIVLVEPYYAGTLVPDICAAMGRTPVRVAALGVPREVPVRYGTREQHDTDLGLTPAGIRERIVAFLAD
jgi:transketolase